MYLTLVCEPQLMNTEEGIKLLEAKRNNNTSVSSDRVTTDASLDLAAWAACNRTRVSASCRVDSSSLIGCIIPDDN